MTENMGKVAVLAVSAVLCSGLVRRGAPEFSLLLGLACGAGVLLLAVEPLENVLQTMRRMAQLAGMGPEVLEPVIKTVALSILTKITGEFCRSGGESGIAAFVETAGTILALGMALPLAEGVLELMGQLLV